MVMRGQPLNLGMFAIKSKQAVDETFNNSLLKQVSPHQAPISRPAMNHTKKKKKKKKKNVTDDQTGVWRICQRNTPRQLQRRF